MTRVKICGINDPASFDAAVEAGADWLGFNFFPASPRYVTPEAAAALSNRVKAGPPCIGLFVDPTVSLIAQVLDIVELGALQIYGAVDNLTEIRQRFGLPVWRAIAVGSATELPAKVGNADQIVLEAKPPPEATRPGGNATMFDWLILQGWKAPIPWILAGGLTPNNVVEAIRISGATAVDVSSGVERRTGVKDPDLIRAFIAAAKSI